MIDKIDAALEISELIAREMSGEISQAEKEKLSKWLSASPKNQQLYHKILNKRNISSRNQLYEGIDTAAGWNKVHDSLNLNHPQKTLYHYLKYAAVILPFLFGITLYFMLDKPSQEAEPIVRIEPGMKQAILVMASGENVNLLNDSVKSLTEDDGTEIHNEKDVLSYAHGKANTAEKVLLNTLLVPLGGEYKLVLSDSTMVYLNSKSKLVFPVCFPGNKREVFLEGEAYFEVAKDKSRPFIVTINGMQIEAVGTAFNIKAYTDESHSFTTLLEGKVSVTGPDHATGNVYLEPDMQVMYNPATAEMKMQKVDALQSIEWTTGRMSFTDQSLDDIMKSLSRWYDFTYQFEDPSLKNIKFRGGLNRYESIEPIIEIIKKTGKVNVKVRNKEIIFSKIG